MILIANQFVNRFDTLNHKCIDTCVHKYQKVCIGSDMEIIYIMNRLRPGFMNVKFYILVLPYIVNEFDTWCPEFHGVCICLVLASTPGVTNFTMYIYILCT